MFSAAIAQLVERIHGKDRLPPLELKGRRM